MQPQKIWIEQCEAARGIEDEFGTQQALEYLVGEKFLNCLEAAETDVEFRAEIPAFVAEIKFIFEQWQLAQYLEIARETEPFDSTLFEDQDDFDGEEVEDMRQDDIRQCTRDLLLVEQAREWLLEGESERFFDSLKSSAPESRQASSVSCRWTRTPMPTGRVIILPLVASNTSFSATRHLSIHV